MTRMREQAISAVTFSTTWNIVRRIQQIFKFRFFLAPLPII
jgi:hypothetical protein